MERVRAIYVVALVAALAATGCAGPATPFGAIRTVSPNPERPHYTLASVGAGLTEPQIPPQIFFTPGRQVLHGPATLKIRVVDPLGIPDNHRVVVMHNGYDVSSAFYSQAEKTVVPEERWLELEIPHIRIQPTEANKVQVYYFRDEVASPVARAELARPVCRPFANSEVQTTGPFEVPESMMHMISRVAHEKGYNPAYITGLIAQESGFRNSAVSWAKAVGVTQVTPIAEETIIDDFPQWPRYPGINNMSPMRIKALVLSGRVNGSNEWRLDDELSVRGGLAYLSHVKSFWYTPENFHLIEEAFTDTELGISQVILASYNSGPSRVKRALKEKGADWLQHEELGEARKYVNKIFSFCYHFSEVAERSIADADET